MIVIFLRYQWLSEEDLLELPVGRLLSPGGLVAVWVTNKRKLVESVTGRLFPSWGVTFLAEWLWLKVSYSTNKASHTLSNIVAGNCCGQQCCQRLDLLSIHK